MVLTSRLTLAELSLLLNHFGRHPTLPRRTPLGFERSAPLQTGGSEKWLLGSPAINLLAIVRPRRWPVVRGIEIKLTAETEMTGVSKCEESLLRLRKNSGASPIERHPGLRNAEESKRIVSA